MDDRTLLESCTLQGYQDSGPGGQHRNKTNTGVCLRLEELNLEIRCCEDRSAAINRSLALGRLRLQIALHLRYEPLAQPMRPFPGSNGRVSPDNPGYPAFIADIFDRLEKNTGEIRPAAEAWRLSTSALTRILFANKTVLAATQQLRARHGKPPLRAPGA